MYSLSLWLAPAVLGQGSTKPVVKTNGISSLPQIGSLQWPGPPCSDVITLDNPISILCHLCSKQKNAGLWNWGNIICYDISFCSHGCRCLQLEVIHSLEPKRLQTESHTMTGPVFTGKYRMHGRDSTYSPTESPTLLHRKHKSSCWTTQDYDEQDYVNSWMMTQMDISFVCGMINSNNHIF